MLISATLKSQSTSLRMWAFKKEVFHTQWKRRGLPFINPVITYPSTMSPVYLFKKKEEESTTFYKVSQDLQKLVPLEKYFFSIYLDKKKICYQ